MWSELPSCSMLLLFALVVLVQRFTDGSPMGTREELLVIQVCGERFRPTMRMFCKGVYNNNFATPETGVNAEISESNWEAILDTTNEMKDDIVDKCCRKGCTPSDLKKYCGAGLLNRPMLDTPGISGNNRRKSPGGFPRYVPIVVGYVDIKGNGGVEIGRSPRNVFPNQLDAPTGNLLSNRINPSWKPIKNPRSIFPQRTINSDETTEIDRGSGPGRGFFSPGGQSRWAAAIRGNRVTEGPVPGSFVVAGVGNEYSFSP